jgi:hypothetical protein
MQVELALAVPQQDHGGGIQTGSLAGNQASTRELFVSGAARPYL